MIDPSVSESLEGKLCLAKTKGGQKRQRGDLFTSLLTQVVVFSLEVEPSKVEAEGLP